MAANSEIGADYLCRWSDRRKALTKNVAHLWGIGDAERPGHTALDDVIEACARDLGDLGLPMPEPFLIDISCRMGRDNP